MGQRGFADEVALLNQRKELADLPPAEPGAPARLNEVQRLLEARRKAYDYLFLELARRYGLDAEALRPEMDRAWASAPLPVAQPGTNLSPVVLQHAMRRQWGAYREAMLRLAQVVETET